MIDIEKEAAAINHRVLKETDISGPPDITQDVIALCRRGVAEALEEAAKIAETPYETGFDEGREPALTEEHIRRGIAAAIRSRKEGR